MNNKPVSQSHQLIETSIAQERIRQARHSFNLALSASVLSIGISLAGGVLLLTGKVPEGTVTSAGGLVSSVQSLKLARESNDRLDKILTEIKD